MYFDHPAGGNHPPERSEKEIHAIYRKIFTLVKSAESADETSAPLIITLQGLFGADGAALCHIFDDNARFVACMGQISHIQGRSFNLNAPRVANFMMGKKPLCLSRDQLAREYLNLALNAQFESVLLSPIEINGMPYGLVALTANKPGYFEEKDAYTLFEITKFYAMALDERRMEVINTEQKHYALIGNICDEIAPSLHNATIDLIQTFAQLRKFYVAQKYNLMAEYLSKAVSNIEGMAKRVQDLRSLGDICNPKEQTFGGVDLKSVLESVIDYNRTQIEENVELGIKIDEDLPKVYGDFTLIWQLIHEIVQNSLRAIKKKEQDKHALMIHTYRFQGSVVVEISDTGCGIEPANVPHIFEPFFTTWPSCKGLGLTRARINAYRMQASIIYRPRPEGGSVFRIAFINEQHPHQAEVF